MARGQNMGQNSPNSGTRRKTQNTTRFRPYMRAKLVVFCFIVVLVILFLIATLINITSTSEAKYKKQVLI